MIPTKNDDVKLIKLTKLRKQIKIIRVCVAIGFDAIIYVLNF